MSQQTAAPNALSIKRQRLAKVMTLAGFIPFGGLAIALGILEPSGPQYVQARMALVTYGAVILSFLGGIRWGIALSLDDDGVAARDIFLSVFPSLVGWFALFFAAPFDLAILLAAFVGQMIWDRLALRDGKIELWFMSLRYLITALVAAALVMALMS